MQFMSIPALINYFADFEQIKKLLLEKIHDLRDTMSRHWSLSFFIITMLLTGHHAMPVVI